MPSTTDQKITTLEEFGQNVMRRRSAVGGDINVPRNSGIRRTASKRALLAAIEASGKVW